MPYNVIIMTSTVMAVFFGLMHGALTRRWGWVELPQGDSKGAEIAGENGSIIDGEKIIGAPGS
jgi:hypothetical protein